MKRNYVLDKLMKIVGKEKAPYSVRIFPKCVWKITKNKERFKEATELIREVNMFVHNLDLFYETKKREYKDNAKVNRNNVINYATRHFGQNFVEDLQSLEEEVTKFFRFEEEVWSKVLREEPLTDHEVREYIRMRAGDAKVYSRIIEEFTGRDLTVPLVGIMQLLDIKNDLAQYEADLKGNLPNVLYMLSYQVFRESFPSYPLISIRDFFSGPTLTRIVSEGRTRLDELTKEIAKEATDFDFMESRFLKGEIIELKLDITTPGWRYTVR